MSAIFPDRPLADLPASPAAEIPASRLAFLNEPLLHFLLIGALLFAFDHLLVVRADDPHTIVIGSEVDSEARATFRTARGQDPTPVQLAALRQHWLDNEVLYREGLALRVDQGDATIRERVIFKALNIVEASLKLPPVDDQTLRAWFETRHEKYDEPPRVDFSEAVLSGSSSEAAVRTFVGELNTGTGSTRAGLNVFKARPHATIVQSYGVDFAKALEESPAGEWRALGSRDGWHAVRVEAAMPGKPAAFESMRNVVQQDWTDATMSELRTAAVRELAKKYSVRSEGAKP